MRRNVGLRKEDSGFLNEDSFFVEPKGLISMSPPTGSMYAKDDLTIVK
jgi:hypothetical protein